MRVDALGCRTPLLLPPPPPPPPPPPQVLRFLATAGPHLYLGISASARLRVRRSHSAPFRHNPLSALSRSLPQPHAASASTTPWLLLALLAWYWRLCASRVSDCIVTHRRQQPHSAPHLARCPPGARVGDAGAVGVFCRSSCQSCPLGLTLGHCSPSFPLSCHTGEADSICC